MAPTKVMLPDTVTEWSCSGLRGISAWFTPFPLLALERQDRMTGARDWAPDLVSDTCCRDQYGYPMFFMLVSTPWPSHFLIQEIS